MVLKKEEYASVIDLPAPDERIIRYLKGETIEIEDGESTKDAGWQLVCVDGYPLGWGKLIRGTLRNKYFSGNPHPSNVHTLCPVQQKFSFQELLILLPSVQILSDLPYTFLPMQNYRKTLLGFHKKPHSWFPLKDLRLYISPIPGMLP